MLYSGKRVLPIYSKPALLQVSKGLKGNFHPNSTVYEMQQFILSQKPPGEPIEYYAARIYETYRLKDRKFYIIGSKYDDNGQDTKDVFPQMLQYGDVAIGFMDYFNFGAYLHQNATETDKTVAANYREKKPDVTKIKRYFRLLLQMKEGDIIAVKSHGSHGTLTIIAYATVVARNGSIYSFRPDQLGHHIHVEFTDWGFKKKTGLNYAETLHEIKTDHAAFTNIFGPYALFAKGNPLATSDQEPEDTDVDRNEDDYTRGFTSQVIVKQVHNMMQNRLKHLKSKYPGHTVKREYENRVDVYRQHNDIEWFYEIKPFESAYRCVREGIGQLLDYAHRFESDKKLQLIIVGPEKASAIDRRFIEHIQQTLDIDFDYQWFDYIKHS
jgi:hypothetical protein